MYVRTTPGYDCRWNVPVTCVLDKLWSCTYTSIHLDLVGSTENHFLSVLGYRGAIRISEKLVCKHDNASLITYNTTQKQVTCRQR